MMLRYVAQPNGYGCVVASVAMIVGRTYDEMEQWLLEAGLRRERVEHGLYDVIYLEALARHGFIARQMWRHDPLANQSRTAWPPEPFAPIHICTADVAAGHHAFVMLGDGSVLDPFNRERTSLTHPDYRKIDSVVGLWRCPA